MVGDRAQPALELVGYDAELSAAMKYAFGSAFVCKVRVKPAASAPSPQRRHVMLFRMLNHVRTF